MTWCTLSPRVSILIILAKGNIVFEIKLVEKGKKYRKDVIKSLKGINTPQGPLTLISYNNDSRNLNPARHTHRTKRRTSRRLFITDFVLHQTFYRVNGGDVRGIDEINKTRGNTRNDKKRVYVA